MTDLLNLTRDELENLVNVLNKELAVLVDEQILLNDAIDRINRNMQVVSALLDLKQIQEKKQEKVNEQPKYFYSLSLIRLEAKKSSPEVTSSSSGFYFHRFDDLK